MTFFLFLSFLCSLMFLNSLLSFFSLSHISFSSFSFSSFFFSFVLAAFWVFFSDFSSFYFSFFYPLFNLFFSFIKIINYYRSLFKSVCFKMFIFIILMILSKMFNICLSLLTLNTMWNALARSKPLLLVEQWGDGIGVRWLIYNWVWVGG